MPRIGLLMQGAALSVVCALPTTLRAEVAPDLATGAVQPVISPEVTFDASSELAGFQLSPKLIEPLHVSEMAVTKLTEDFDTTNALPPAPVSAASVEPPRERYRFSTYTRQTGLVKWEVLGILAAMTATRYSDITKGGSKFYVKSEGWFGRNTRSAGMDKFHHAWKTYVVADVLQSMIENRQGGDKKGAALTSAILSLGIFSYGEILDGFTAKTGYSNQDWIMHGAGAGVALARNLIPGLRNKLDFRMEHKFGSASAKGGGNQLTLDNQLERRRYLFAWQLAGHESLERSPLRFVELHLGYYARNFSKAARLAGEPLKRKVFVGLGFNVQQLFAREPKSRWERYAKGVFDYYQVPYTSVHN